MTGLTSLECAVLSAICDCGGAYGVTLRNLLMTVNVTSRENTGHGFYTKLSVDHALPPVHIQARFLDGPVAWMTDMGEGMTMGFMLWLDSGYPDELEGFQYCDSKGETTDLKTYDLTRLAFTRLEPAPRTA